MSGYMRPSILWHLSRVGAADVATLARIIGRPKQATATVVRRMRGRQELADCPYSHGRFELTAKGLEAAHRVRPEDVETAQCVEQLVQETRSNARDAEVQALASKLCVVALAASSHAVSLEALLRAFEATAVSYPCCTQPCAEAAMQVSMRLAAAAASRPADAPIH